LSLPESWPFWGAYADCSFSVSTPQSIWRISRYVTGEPDQYWIAGLPVRPKSARAFCACRPLGPHRIMSCSWRSPDSLFAERPNTLRCGRYWQGQNTRNQQPAAGGPEVQHCILSSYFVEKGGAYCTIKQPIVEEQVVKSHDEASTGVASASRPPPRGASRWSQHGGGGLVDGYLHTNKPNNKSLFIFYF
jgi:hypothetical protein